MEVFPLYLKPALRFVFVAFLLRDGANICRAHIREIVIERERANPQSLLWLSSGNTMDVSYDSKWVPRAREGR